MQCSEVKCSAVHCSVVQYSAVQCSAVQGFLLFSKIGQIIIRLGASVGIWGSALGADEICKDPNIGEYWVKSWEILGQIIGNIR